MKKITVKVKPSSKRGPLVMAENNVLTVYVRERAVDGEANDAVIKLLAKRFSVAKSKIKIIRGQTSKDKIIEII